MGWEELSKEYTGKNFIKDDSEGMPFTRKMSESMEREWVQFKMLQRFFFEKGFKIAELGSV